MSETGSIERAKVSFPVAFLGWIVLIVFAVSVGLFIVEKRYFSVVLEKISPFKISDVKLSSEWPLSVNEVKSWLPILEGKSLLNVQPQEIIENLQTHSWVQSVVVKKQFPNRILIDVETKRPQAMTVIKGQTYFLDVNGSVIEKARPQVLRALDLPFLSVSADSQKWNMPTVLAMVDKFKKVLPSKMTISQVVLGSYPFFKIFLDNPRVEVVLNVENWETQTSILSSLLVNPPKQIGQIQRINLIFPKKAVLSPSK